MKLEQAFPFGQALDPLFAQLENDVGRFLQLRGTLTGLQSVAPQPYQPRVADLLAAQNDLEARLPNVIGAAARLKQQGVSIGGMMDIAPFVFQMETQISNVEVLKRDLSAQGITAPEGGIGSIIGSVLQTPHLWWWLIGAFFLWRLLR